MVLIERAIGSCASFPFDSFGVDDPLGASMSEDAEDFPSCLRGILNPWWSGRYALNWVCLLVSNLYLSTPESLLLSELSFASFAKALGVGGVIQLPADPDPPVQSSSTPCLRTSPRRQERRVHRHRYHAQAPHNVQHRAVSSEVRIFASHLPLGQQGTRVRISDRALIFLFAFSVGGLRVGLGLRSLGVGLRCLGVCL